MALVIELSLNGEGGLERINIWLSLSLICLCVCMCVFLFVLICFMVTYAMREGDLLYLKLPPLPCLFCDPTINLIKFHAEGPVNMVYKVCVCMLVIPPSSSSVAYEK